MATKNSNGNGDEALAKDLYKSERGNKSAIELDQNWKKGAKKAPAAPAKKPTAPKGKK
jgi:hypothetical protein